MTPADVRRLRRDQGLPGRIVDPDTVDRIAAVLLAAPAGRLLREGARRG